MMYYDDDMIVGKVSKRVRERTRENMDTYCMGLADAFKEAAKEYARPGTELYKAWYHNDFRKYIPSAYRPEYLDFEKYPLRYS